MGAVKLVEPYQITDPAHRQNDGVYKPNQDN